MKNTSGNEVKIETIHLPFSALGSAAFPRQKK
jgi:hypothetical protein